MTDADVIEARGWSEFSAAVAEAHGKGYRVTLLPPPAGGGHYRARVERDDHGEDPE